MKAKLMFSNYTNQFIDTGFYRRTPTGRFVSFQCYWGRHIFCRRLRIVDSYGNRILTRHHSHI